MDVVDRPDGIRLPYVVERGVGPQLVFAHGLMATGVFQRAQLRALVETGWTVVTFDQRGHAAASPVLEAAGYDPSAMGEDLWAVADAAGVDRCWIGGGSMGAATSFRAAVAHPERVEGLVQVVPPLRDRPHPMTIAFDALADRVHEAGIEGLIETLRVITGGVGLDEVGLFFDQLRTHDPASLEVALRSVPRWILDDVPSAFADLPFPVIVFGWDDDPIHPLETARDVAAAAGVDLIELEQSAAMSNPLAFGEVLIEALAAGRA